MDKIELLVQEFQNDEIEFGKDILKNMSTKTDDGILFSPYIPFVGKNHQEFRILVYSTAQNIRFDSFRNSYQQNLSKLTERLYYFDNFKKKYPESKISYQNIAINPYQTGVIAALLGVFIYAKFNKKIECLDEITELISISNYYKFSLNNGNHDINPEPTGKNKIHNYIQDSGHVKHYWSVNDDLVKKEIDALNPEYILSFKGRKIKRLKCISNNKFQVIEINDPSWILYGAGGLLSKNGSWWKKAMNCKETEVNKLIDHYLNNITGSYKGKKDGVRIYLLKYYSDWKRKNNAR